MYMAPYFSKALVAFNHTTINRILTALNDVLAFYDKKHWVNSRMLFTGVITFEYVFGSAALRKLYTRHTYIVRDVLRQVGRLYVHYDGRGLIETDQPSFCHLPTSIVITTLLWEFGDRAKDNEPTTIDRELYNAEQLIALFGLDDDARNYVRRWARHHLKTYLNSQGLYSCGKPFEAVLITTE